jgi:hypothetical protein
VPVVRSHRITLVIALSYVLAPHCFGVSAKPHRPPKFERSKEEKAWINGKGMCVFPFAADELPDTADDFAAAMARGYRRSLKLPHEDAPIVVAAGGTYPAVESLKIDVCDAQIYPERKGRTPSDRQLAIHGLDAAHFELLGHRMSMEHATLNLDMTATDARLLFTRDANGKPLLMLGAAKAGRVKFEVTLDDVERMLRAEADRAARPYGLDVSRARLKMAVDGDGRTVRVDLKLSTRLGFVPAGLRFRARLDIDDDLRGRLSELSCTGDEVLGPLISGIISPFLARYNGKTRPLMNFPATDMRLRGVDIVADHSIRLAADFGN